MGCVLQGREQGLSYSGERAVSRARPHARPSTAHRPGEGTKQFPAGTPGREGAWGTAGQGTLENPGEGLFRFRGIQCGGTGLRGAEGPAELGKQRAAQPVRTLVGTREAVAGVAQGKQSDRDCIARGSPSSSSAGASSAPPPSRKSCKVTSGSAPSQVFQVEEVEHLGETEGYQEREGAPG